MATLFELKEEILKGRKVKRKDWKNDEYPFLGFYEVYPGDIFADDWELEPLPKKKVTMYQFISKSSGEVWFSETLHKSEADFKLVCPYAKILKTIPHEIEVEE